ncbi:ribonuclease HII [Neosynechococcus sphagnicola]|uniref:ribonuclease HII n=1 Tax=Neosynechococcus sphagnicola TaxID=1501145 RepID=UPI000907D5FC|nr:ribonuclease HII [Neosynechococcus sphagnicola]
MTCGYPWEQIAGVDEVGRGALFGPVVAAAVILPETAMTALTVAGVTDSKKLSAARRQQLAGQIRDLALDCQIGSASVGEIDRLNILQASLLAMKRAIRKLQVTPHLCLIDGNQLIPDLGLPQQTLVKGDQQSLVIGAASIIAKVWRDRLLEQLALKYPHYDLAANRGYGSSRHHLALQEWGISPLHRRSFRPCQVQQPQGDE